MMQGDEIRNQRQIAQNADTDHNTLESHATVALWVIAEQLFELRSLVGIVTDSERKEINIFVNGGEVTAKGE
jgi:hypothetical protein